MSPFHGRWRRLVSLLAAEALDPHDEAAVREHLRTCEGCRSDHERSVRALDVLSLDPVRSAEMPVPVAFLRRVRARLDGPNARVPSAGAWPARAGRGGVAIVPVLVHRGQPPAPWPWSRPRSWFPTT